MYSEIPIFMWWVFYQKTIMLMKLAQNNQLIFIVVYEWKTDGMTYSLLMRYLCLHDSYDEQN